MEDYALVYQCGIANVFRTGEAPPVRVMQHAFAPCEAYCAGLREAGKRVGVFHCDQAGDISAADWERGPGEMFRDGKNPPRVWDRCKG